MNPQVPQQGQYPDPSRMAPPAGAAPQPQYPSTPSAIPQAPPIPTQPPQAFVDPRYATQPQQGYAQPAAPQVYAAPAPTAQSPTPQPLTNPNSTQNTLQIAEIRDGVVIMNDGSFRSVLMVKSINFDLMSIQEQEAVELAYQNFLNSLYFPLQIFVRSQKVDLRPYIEKLDKIRTEHDNMLLALLMDDYIGYIDALSQQTNIMDKKFYIVIPYSRQLEADKPLGQSKNFFTGFAALLNSKPQHVTINEADLETAKSELRNRVQAVLNGLMQCGIQGLPLDTHELIELYYDTYNPDTATRQELKNFNELSVEMITKGQGTATQPHLQRELQ
ncbi:MAG TPA: hypothetical protein VK983_05665 [Candidatus Limnocylindrales bacterium]|nr:hypothetical protein [Candidatus Limnocylindrales bacterium]